MSRLLLKLGWVHSVEVSEDELKLQSLRDVVVVVPDVVRSGDGRVDDDPVFGHEVGALVADVDDDLGLVLLHRSQEILVHA